MITRIMGFKYNLARLNQEALDNLHGHLIRRMASDKRDLDRIVEEQLRRQRERLPAA